MGSKRKSNASQDGDENHKGSTAKRQRKSSGVGVKPATSEEERKQLRDWLDAREKDPKVPNIFEVSTFPIPKTKKGRPYAGPTQQLSLGGKDHMAVAYKVTDSAKWNRIPKYKKFTLPSGDTHAIGSCVFINHVDPMREVVDEDELWKAQILDIRALDSGHVYARVVWLEIPRELPNGAEKYHASNELVASNEMAVVSASTVNGGFQISYWNDADDEAPLPDPESYFWRQYYDKRTGQLSELRKICLCQEPHSPEEVIIRCSNEDCKIWLHGRCIVDDMESRIGTPARKKKGRPSNASKHASDVNGDHGTGDKRVSISIPGEGAAPKLRIKDVAEDGEVREDNVRCLKCEQVIV